MINKIILPIISMLLLGSCTFSSENGDTSSEKKSDSKMTQNTQARTPDRSNPKSVIQGYASAMEGCNLHEGLDYFDPSTRGLILGSLDIANEAMDLAKGMANELGEKKAAKDIQDHQDKIGKLPSVSPEVLDETCKKNNDYIKNLSIVDEGEITTNKAKFKVTYTLKNNKKTEDWFLKKIGNDWFLLADEEKENAPVMSSENDSQEKKVVEKQDTQATSSDSSLNQKIETKLPKDVNESINEELFSAEQLKEIRYGQEGKLDVSTYAKPSFSAEQMKEIRYGLEGKLDVSMYAMPSFSTEQMKEIRYGLEEKLDVSTYAKPSFSTEQMKEIRYGLEEKLDVSTYAKPSLSTEEMIEARHKLQNN